MAEPPLHNTASAEHPDDIPPCNDAGSASTEVRGLGSSDAVAPVSLPLRQALRSPVAGAGPKMHDITEKFTRACNALDVGQLVKDEFFTLFESIGAIEIMDPKMDSGFLQPGETLEDNYDTLKPLLPEELIGIMDQLLCYEMAWHTGYPLSQTLFTSVYIDKLLWPEPKTLVQAQFYRGDIADDRRPGPLLEVLRAYCLALIKGCDFIIAKITGRDFFEEEDFCTHTYNRVLFVMVPMDVFMRELDAAIETMEDTDNDINDGLRLAIISRLHFRKDFLAALDLDCPLDYLPNYWPPIVQCISHIASTHQLGALVPGAFSTKMQRRLASTVPPRPIVELEFKDALEKLKQMCMDCEEATRFVNLPQDPLEYQSFLWAFSSRTPTPLAYARSYLSTLLFHPEILNPSVSLPLADAKALIFPSSPVLDPVNWTLSPPRNPLLPKPPRLQFALIIDDFVQSVGPPYLDLWVALGQNRCRLRRMLTHVIVSWDLLQGDASLLDSELVRTAQELNVEDQLLEFPLSTWVYHKKLWMIEKVILLGFEQDLYLPDEFAGMYLFLSLIATRRKELLRRIELHHVTRGDQLIAARNIIGVREIDAATPYLDSVLDTAEATSELASALYRFYTVLLYLHLLPEPKRPFSSEELRYGLRMKPFLTLNPPEAPPFPDFQAHLQPYGPYNSPDPSAYNDIKNPVSNLWLDIDANIKAAKDAFSRLKKAGPAAARAQGVEMAWVKEVQGGLASCVALGVAMAGVKSAVTDKDVGAGEALGIQVDVPEVGAGKRYAEGWVIGKVSKV